MTTGSVAETQFPSSRRSLDSSSLSPIQEPKGKPEKVEKASAMSLRVESSLHSLIQLLPCQWNHFISSDAIMLPRT